jgi:hypothetical protein
LPLPDENPPKAHPMNDGPRCPRAGAVSFLQTLHGNRPLFRNVDQSMDTEAKREFWMLAIGTVMVEVPLAAIAVLLVLGH